MPLNLSLFKKSAKLQSLSPQKTTFLYSSTFLSLILQLTGMNHSDKLSKFNLDALKKSS
jgi:hypothetical protein